MIPENKRKLQDANMRSGTLGQAIAMTKEMTKLLLKRSTTKSAGKDIKRGVKYARKGLGIMAEEFGRRYGKGKTNAGLTKKAKAAKARARMKKRKKNKDNRRRHLAGLKALVTGG